MADKTGGILNRLGTPADTNVSTDLVNIQTSINGLGGSNQTITVTETEPMVAGDIAVMTDQGGCIPFSSLEPRLITQIGTITDNVLGGNDIATSVVWVYPNIFVEFFADASGTNYPTATACRLNNDGSIIKGPNYVLIYGSGTCYTPDITQIADDGVFIAVCNLNNSTLKGIAGQVYLDLTMDVGTHYTLAAINPTPCLAVAKNTNYAFSVVYNSSGAVGYFVSATVNSSTLAITGGTPVRPDTAPQFEEVAICQLEDLKVAYAYESQSDNDGYVNIATIAGTVATFGSNTTFTGGLNAAYGVTIDAMSPSLIVVGTGIDPGGTNLKANAATISGLVPSFGSMIQISPDTSRNYSIKSLNNNYFLSFWDNSINNITEYSISSVDGVLVEAGGVLSTGVDAPAGGCDHNLSISAFGDVVYLGNISTILYALLFDLGYIDDETNNFKLYDITGVVSDTAGKVIVDGINEGSISGEDPRATYFFDSSRGCVRKKGHSNQFGYKARVRVLDTDALKAIGG